MIHGPYNIKSNQTVVQDINMLRKDCKPSLTICKSKNGDIITEKDVIIKTIFRSFSIVWSRNRKYPQNRIIETLMRKTPPTVEEAEMANQKLKKCKAPGTDNIPAELFIYGGNEIVKHLHIIIQEIWATEEIPTDWNLSIVCPKHKKENLMECSNY